ncbi:Abhydrolase domain-containing protein mpaH [Pseudocercospora fuligena]|uniref:Abhydrolase domain-containing protein mpaH n=1 Tax=Pseudocercospora fuligena TaxID=685502 RepID=A0A8H6R4U3_9PEZI|nr:Abhydrolase domain-containing protein mpaH [Pseudocercospora fuligena]
MSPFVIEEHVFEGQHIREYPAALANSQEDVIKLHAKSYTPHEVASGKANGDLTVIAYHANAFQKEVYEPFFEQLYETLKEKHGVTLGGIWIADQAQQGTSAILNDEIIGNDPHWWDHSRDILCMVNAFRSKMRRPIMAVGHSMGGTQAVATAHYHPRLFESVVLIDPPMTMKASKNVHAMIKFSLSKKESFKSREEAEQSVRKNPFFKSWKPAVMERYIDTAFHDAPTVLVPEEGVTKPTTTVHQDILTLARPNLDHVAVASPVDNMQRYTHPDVDNASPYTGPLYNPHSRQAYTFLGSLRPAAQWILAKNSQIAPQDELEFRTNLTGSYAGGSGGVKAGNVESVTIRGGHFLPFTNPEGTAKEAADFLSRRLRVWREAEERFTRKMEGRSKKQRQKLSPEVERTLRNWDGKLWENPNALPDGGKSRL